jgi:hypothetical protein
MKRCGALAVAILSLLVLIDCDVRRDATRERQYVSAHEQPLRALAEEWLSEGPLVMAHGDMKVPFGGVTKEVHTVPDAWWGVPRADDWREVMYRGIWWWQAHDAGWWIQSPRLLETGGAPFQVASLDEVDSRLNMSEGRVARWMELLPRNAISRIERGGVATSSVQITFQDSALKSVFFIPGVVRERADEYHTGFRPLTERWYYYDGRPRGRRSLPDPP